MVTDPRLNEFLSRALLLDLETGPTGEVHKLVAIRGEATFERQGHFDTAAALADLDHFAADAELLLGHNLLGHDLHCLGAEPGTDRGTGRGTGDRPRLLAAIPPPPPTKRPTDMPRHARIVVAGFPMHAILRGIDRAAIFFSDADDRAFLEALAGLAASEAVRIHAYVMMTNHVHLLMTYLALAETDDPRRAAYRNLFADAISEDALVALRDATNGGFVLGSSRFQRQIAAMVGRRTWPGKSGRPKKEPPDANQLDLPL